MIEIEIEGGHHEYWYTVAEVAKMLNFTKKDNDLKRTKHHIGRNLMFKVLKFNKVLSKKDNSPAQSYINLGLAKLHSTNIRWKRYTLPVFSEKGIEYLKKQFASGKYVVQYEPTVRNKHVKSLEEVC